MASWRARATARRFGAELPGGPAAGLDRVAVRAEGHHLGRVVGAAEGQVLDVVDLQDRVAAVVRSWMSPVQRRFSHRPPLRTRTARRAAAERTGVLAVRFTRAPARSSAPLLAIAYSSR